MKRTKAFWVLTAAVAALVAAGAVASGPLASQVEQPAYETLSADGPIEVRAYGPEIAAEVVVRGERKQAIAEGFRQIAAYIFGANRARMKIAMTAPVEQQQAIAMSAPVSAQATGGAWTIRFIMPKGLTLDTLPKPDDGRVTLSPIPARRVIAIRFSGWNSTSLLDEKTAALRAYAARHDLKTDGEPCFAFYNPPWTLPFLRRNEVMLTLAAT